jgi:hypothetical protein
MQSGSFPIEYIIPTYPPSSPIEINGVLNDIPTSTNDASQPPIMQSGMRRACMTRKNSNWSDEQLFSAIATHDNGMSMKKASEQLHIPYNSS